MVILVWPGVGYVIAPDTRAQKLAKLILHAKHLGARVNPDHTVPPSMSASAIRQRAGVLAALFTAQSTDLHPRRKAGSAFCTVPLRLFPGLGAEKTIICRHLRYIPAKVRGMKQRGGAGCFSASGLSHVKQLRRPIFPTRRQD